MSNEFPESNQRNGRTDNVTLPVVQEFLNVTTQTVETGSVRVRKVMGVTQEDVTLKGRTSRVHITRTPMLEAVEKQSEPRQEGAEWIIPVYETRPVTVMQLFLVEEIRLSTVVSDTEKVESVLLQKEDVVIERRVGVDGEWHTLTPDKV